MQIPYRVYSVKESKEATKCNGFLKSVVYCSNCLRIDWQNVISGQILQRQFLNNSNDGFLEQLVPQSGGKKKKEEAILDLNLSNTVT